MVSISPWSNTLLVVVCGDYRGVSLGLRIEVPHGRIMRAFHRRGVSPSTTPDVKSNDETETHPRIHILGSRSSVQANGGNRLGVVKL